MPGQPPLTIRYSLWLALGLTVASTVLGVAALYGYQLYRTNRAAEHLRATTFAETYAAQIAPLRVNLPEPDFQAAIERFAWHPDTYLLAVLDSNERVLALRGSESLLKTCLRRLPEDLRRGVVVWHDPGDPARHIPELLFAAAPIIPAGGTESIGTVFCGTRPALGQAGFNMADAWTFFVGLVLVALTGMTLGFLWLKRKVLEPVSLLTRQVNHLTGDEPLPTDRPDEIGDLARTLHQMRSQLRSWRQRATHLERRFSDRVARETRQISRELARAEKEVWTDSLTRLGNRRLLNDKLGLIFQAQHEAGQDLSIVMLDLDHFKTTNDTLGHAAGDEVLAFVGELLQQCLREQDIAVRYGGDEFVLVLPGVSTQQAAEIAERAVRLFAQQAKLLPVEPKPTMSAGIASLRDHAPANENDLLGLADRALYAAKRAGRSCIEIYANEAVTARS